MPVSYLILLAGFLLASVVCATTMPDGEGDADTWPR